MCKIFLIVNCELTLLYLEDKVSNFLAPTEILQDPFLTTSQTSLSHHAPYARVILFPNMPDLSCSKAFAYCYFWLECAFSPCYLASSYSPFKPQNLPGLSPLLFPSWLIQPSTNMLTYHDIVSGRKQGLPISHLCFTSLWWETLKYQMNEWVSEWVRE